MEHQQQDQVFYTNFSIVMATLFGIFFICIIAAAMVSPKKAHTELEIAALQQRLAPIGQVVTDPAALLKAQPEKAARLTMSGDDILAATCNACHMTGVLGAPKEGDKAAWAARLQAAGSVDALAHIAMTGKNAMPPRGGNPDLTDDEVTAAVQAMLGKAGL